MSKELSKKSKTSKTPKIPKNPKSPKKLEKEAKEISQAELKIFKEQPNNLHNKLNSVGLDSEFESEITWEKQETIYYKKQGFFSKLLFPKSKVFSAESEFNRKKEKIESLIKKDTSTIPVSVGIVFDEANELLLETPKNLMPIEEQYAEMQKTLTQEEEKVEITPADEIKPATPNNDIDTPTQDTPTPNLKSSTENEENIEPFITQVKVSDIKGSEDSLDGISQEEAQEVLSASNSENNPELFMDSAEVQEDSSEPKDIFEYAKAPLATVDEIQELEKEHIEFYNILAVIQETHTPNDFKSAYNIQDRISYLLNHRTLLYHDLVLKLISYLRTINQKLKHYYDEISEKQEQLKKYNGKISEIKEYKWKADNSVNTIEENKAFLEDEFSKNTEDRRTS